MSRQPPVLQVINSLTPPGVEAPLEASQTVVERDSRRKNHPGWRGANAARRRYGKAKAFNMLILRFGKCRAADIAEMYGTTRAAVYQRLHRLRSGFYQGAVRPRSRRAGPISISYANVTKPISGQEAPSEDAQSHDRIGTMR